MCFVLGRLSQGKPQGILLKDVNSVCIMTLGLLKEEKLKCILVSPWRQRKANNVYHNTFHPLAWRIFHPVSRHSVPERYSLRPLPSDPDFCTSSSRQPSQTRGFLPHKNMIWSIEVRQKKREQLAYLLLFPAWQKSGEKQSMGWSEKSIKNSLSTRRLAPACSASLQLRAHLPAAGTHTPPHSVTRKGALLTLWICGPNVPQNDIFHSNGAGHFLI